MPPRRNPNATSDSRTSARPKQKAGSTQPQPTPKPQGIRAGGAGQKRANAVAPTSRTRNAAQDIPGHQRHTQTHALPPGGSGVSDPESGSDGDDDDGDEVESDPPRPPPRTARGNARAAPSPRPEPRVSKTPKTKSRESEPEAEAEAESSAEPEPAPAPPPTRTTRTRAAPAATKPAPRPAPARPARATRARPSRTSNGARAQSESDVPEPTGLTSDSNSSDSDNDDDDEGDNFVGSSDSDVADNDDESMDSDDLDDDSPPLSTSKGNGAGKGNNKRKANAKAEPPVPSAQSKRVKTMKTSASKAKKTVVLESDDEIELEEGQEIAGRIEDAPKSGWVPAGQISQNTMRFLGSLLYEHQNTREWFKNHEPWFRRAEKEWRDFVQVLLSKMAEKDPQLPIVPARDLCHRIYRDIRFSPDKTPYKPNFGLTVSRSGRRGIWAGYHMYLQPGETFIACGTWQPEKDVLQRIRARLLAPNGAHALRAAISAPAFVAMFGAPQPKPKGGRQSVFGHSDQLKVAPKGVDKAHPDIDLLKLKSVVVVKNFTEAQVAAPDFADIVAHAVGIMAPFVHTLNDYIAPVHQVVDDSDDSGIELVD